MEAKARHGKGKSSFLIRTEKRNGKVFVWWIMEEAATEAKKVLILLWAIWSLNTINLVSWNSVRNQKDKKDCQMKKGKLLLIKRFCAAHKKLLFRSFHATLIALPCCSSFYYRGALACSKTLRNSHWSLLLLSLAEPRKMLLNDIET